MVTSEGEKEKLDFDDFVDLWKASGKKMKDLKVSLCTERRWDFRNKFYIEL